MKLRPGDVTWREIDGDLVILDLRSSTYLTTNASGAVLMRELTEERSQDQLVRALMDEFSITKDLASSDVRSFVQALTDAGLLLEESAGV